MKFLALFSILLFVNLATATTNSQVVTQPASSESSNQVSADVHPEKKTMLTNMRDLVNDERNFKKGQWRNSIGLGIGYSSFTGFIFGLSMRPEKFVIDKLAVGGELSYLHNGGRDTYKLGPSATYQFWNHKAWRSFFGQKFIWAHYDHKNRYSDRNDYYSATEFGIGWGLLEAFVEHRELFDDSIVTSSGPRGGVRVSVFF